MMPQSEIQEHLLVHITLKRYFLQTIHIVDLGGGDVKKPVTIHLQVIIHLVEKQLLQI